MATLTLSAEDRAQLAKRISSYEQDLVVAWLATKDPASSIFKVVAATVRPPLPQEGTLDLVTDEVILYTSVVSAAEAATQIANRTLEGPSEIAFELVGDHSPQPYWLSSDTTGFGFGYSPPWPQFYVSWPLDGVQELAQRVRMWEPISTPELAFEYLREAVATHLYGMLLQPTLLTSIDPSLVVRIPYPVRLGPIAQSSNHLVVEVEEDALGAAANHSLLIGIREVEADPTFHQATYVVKSAGPSVIPLPESVIKAVIRLRNQNHEERDRRDWIPPAQTSSKSESTVVSLATIVETTVPMQDRVTREPAPDFGPICEDASWIPMLAIRWEEAQRARGAQANLAAIIMMGSLLEGALFAFCSKREATAIRFAPKGKDGGKAIDDWTLADLLNVARACGWLSRDRTDFGQVLRDYRNLVHPRKQAQLAVEPDSRTVDICWEVTRAVIHDLLSSASA
jgi:hypothetical protein